MKFKKLNLILPLLLSFSFIQSAFEFDQDFFNTHTTTNEFKEITLYELTTAYSAVAASYIILNGLELISSYTNKNTVIQKYPFAQKWYDEIAKKYPSSGLDKNKFLCSPAWMAQDNMVFQSKFNHIYCPEEALKAIDVFYKNKTTSQTKKGLTLKEDTTQDDELDIKIAEFLLMRQAYHCKYQTTVQLPLKCLAASIATAVIGEELQTSYLNKNPTAQLHAAAPVKIIISLGLCMHFSEAQELEADIFAYEISTDFNIFSGAFAYFEQDLSQFTINATRLNALNDEYSNAIQRICKKN